MLLNYLLLTDIFITILFYFYTQVVNVTVVEGRSKLLANTVMLILYPRQVTLIQHFQGEKKSDF